MDEVMKKLSEIEVAAAAIVAHAEAQKEVLDEQYRVKKEQFDQELEVKTSKRIQEIKDALENDKSQLLDTQSASSCQSIRDLETEFNKNHTRIAQEIVSRIITVS